MSLWDRTVFGSISALIGALLGVVAAFLGAVAFDSAPAWRSILAFSVLFFFCVGATRGAEAGFIVGDALSAIAGIGAAAGGIAVGNTKRHDEPRSWSSAGLLGIWIGVVAILAWRA